MLSIEAAKQVVLLDPMHMEARALLSKYNDNTNSLGMKMQLIPTGSFKQGSPINARQISHRYGMDQKYFKEEVPQFPVQITKPFYMSATLVTRGQFARFIHQTGYQTSAQKDKNKTAELNAVNLPGVKRGLTWLEPGFEQQDDHPVVVVSWDDASAFCAWLSEREGRTYHMPTESQWEYACRAGSSTAYWWGDTMQEGQGKANVCDMSTAAWMIDHFGKEPANYEHWDDGYANTSPVGSFAANPWGLYDLHGNVSEWCDSVFESYQSQLVTTTNPIKPPATVRVIRGGSWGSAAAMNRSTYRVRFATVWATNYTGFRVVSESP
jgi:formylglycine-generating enzyme required for sulfatase activity